MTAIRIAVAVLSAWPVVAASLGSCPAGGLRPNWKQMDKQIATLRELPADKQKTIAKLEKRSRELNRQAWKLMATEAREADQLIRQSLELAQRAREIRRQHLEEVMPKVDQINRERAEAAMQMAYCPRQVQ